MARVNLRKINALLQHAKQSGSRGRRVKRAARSDDPAHADFYAGLETPRLAKRKSTPKNGKKAARVKRMPMRKKPNRALRRRRRSAHEAALG